MKKVLSALLVIFCLFTIVSCTQTEPNDVRAKIKAEGYSTGLYEKGAEIEEVLDIFDITDYGVESVVVGYDEDDSSYMSFVYVMFCEDKKSARLQESDCNAFIKNYLDDYLEYEDSDYSSKDYRVMRKGSIVYFGLKDMINSIS